MKRRSALLAGAATLAMVAAACGSGSSSSSSSASGSSSGSGSSGEIVHTNATGTPQKGGVLTMLGTGDVDYMDPNVSYYAVGYLGLRIWSRSLYTYPAQTGKTFSVVPDLATAAPKISADGKTYSITIRQGAMWDATPARQITGADVVRGIKRTCNPTQPFGGLTDFQNLIVGMNAFCQGFSGVSTTDANAQKAYMDGNQISGVTVDPSNPQTVNITLTHPTSYFTDVLALPAFSPAPVEYENYLPASNDLAQHTIADGPYKIASYDPAKTIDFVRNPAWNPSTDPVRKAYVNEIKVNETGDQNAIQQQIMTNSPAADMEWDSYVPTSGIPQLIAQNSPNLNLQTESSTNPYILFNTQSPNENGALKNTAVRQAISYALNRNDMIQVIDGSRVSPPLTHVLPSVISGSQNASYYNFDPNKAKQMLAQAGASNLTLKFLYRPASSASAAIFQTVQNDLGKIGIKVQGVGVPNSDFYTKYLEVPSVAQKGTWDISLAGWSPDWYGDAAASFFSPLFDGRVQPPTSSDFGLYNDPVTNSLIDKALLAPTTAAAAPIWTQADQQVMKDAAIYPITEPNQAVVAGQQVHNRIYMAEYEQFDPTNVWLSGS